MTGRFKKALSEKKTPLWQRKEGKDPDGSLSVAGSKSAGVGRPVTKKPSKLKKGSKAANRRKSFCSRMGGMKKKLTSKKTASDPDSRINKALRKWNCSTDVNPNALQQMAEMITRNIITRDRSGNRGANIKDIMAGLRDEGKAEPKKPEPKKPEPKKPEPKKQEPQQPKPQRASTEIVRNARQGLAEAMLKKDPNLRDRVRKAELQGTPRRIAIEDEKRAQDDARVKDAQGRNTVTGTFGKQGTQTSTTAYGGGGGSEEDITPPMPLDQINRSGSSTAKKATPKQIKAANMKLMKDMGILKFDKEGRRIRR
jgi:hypothetical protein